MNKAHIVIVQLWPFLGHCSAFPTSYDTDHPELIVLHDFLSPRLFLYEEQLLHLIVLWLIVDDCKHLC